jgi:hypothetical protein
MAENFIEVDRGSGVVDAVVAGVAAGGSLSAPARMNPIGLGPTTRACGPATKPSQGAQGTVLMGFVSYPRHQLPVVSAAEMAPGASPRLRLNALVCRFSFSRSRGPAHDPCRVTVIPS